jgi:iron complex transport system permease protein
MQTSPSLRAAAASLTLLGTAMLLALNAGGWGFEAAQHSLILELRTTRMLAAALAGALLAVAGVLMQAVLRNPLADPYILGVSGGASVGALSALTLGAGAAAAQGAAFGGALLALVLVWLLARRLQAARVLLAGVMVAAVAGALTSVLLLMVDDRSLRGMLFWFMGDVGGITQRASLWPPALGLITVLLIVAWRAAPLARTAVGETFAQALGVDTVRERWLAIAAAALATALALWLAGALGFVGLVAPHAARLLGAQRMDAQALAAAVLGASFAMAADALARTVAAPLQLPFGAVTALIGAPLFCVLLLRQDRHGKGIEP